MARGVKNKVPPARPGVNEQVTVPNAINLSHKSLWYIYLHIFAHW